MWLMGRMSSTPWITRAANNFCLEKLMRVDNYGHLLNLTHTSCVHIIEVSIILPMLLLISFTLFYTHFIDLRKYKNYKNHKKEPKSFGFFFSFVFQFRFFFLAECSPRERSALCCGFTATCLFLRLSGRQLRFQQAALHTYRLLPVTVNVARFIFQIHSRCTPSQACSCL